MCPLNFRSWRIWLLILVALFCLVLLFVGGPKSYSQQSYEEAWGLGHIVCFFVWSALFLSWWRERSFARHFIVVIGVTLLLGVGIEIVQIQIGRYFSLNDLRNNLVGSLLVLAFVAPSRLQLKRSTLIVLKITVLSLLAAGLFPLGQALFYEHLARRQFPVLSDFEHQYELNRWTADGTLSISREVSSHGSQSLKIIFNTERYSGVYLRDFPRDWSAYDHLLMAFYNPAVEPLKITCRIHDRSHADNDGPYDDRFNQSFWLNPGWTRIELSLESIAKAPRTRALELENVAALGFFVTRQPEAEILYLDHVTLDR